MRDIKFMGALCRIRDAIEPIPPGPFAIPSVRLPFPIRPAGDPPPPDMKNRPVLNTPGGSSSRLIQRQQRRRAA